MMDSFLYESASVSVNTPPVPLGRAGQTFAKADLWTPTEHTLGEGDIGASALRVVVGQRHERQLGVAPGDVEHGLSELEHGALIGIAEVDRTDVIALEEPQEAVDQVVNETELRGV